MAFYHSPHRCSCFKTDTITRNKRYGTPLPKATIEAVRRNKVAIKGPITTPVGTGFRSVNVALRKTLNLNVCLRPVLSIPGAGGRYQDVDLVIVRENSEDLYAGIEFEEGSKEAAELIEFCKQHDAGTIRSDSGISIKPISVTASQNIVRYAFDYAVKHGRKKVTAAHKANIMKHSDGLFLRTAREVAADYEGSIEFNDNIIDAFCMNLVMDPSQFDVIVFPNLYGDITSDLCAGFVNFSEYKYPYPFCVSICPILFRAQKLPKELLCLRRECYTHVWHPLEYPGVRRNRRIKHGSTRIRMRSFLRIRPLGRKFRFFTPGYSRGCQT